MLLSVIVSTVGRPERLLNLARSLEESGRHFKKPWELVVIDNHPEPNEATSTAIAQISSFSGLTLVPLIERRRGKSRAVNMAVKETRGEFLAITDDDCVVSPDWLSAIYREFATDSELAVVGGRVELFDKRDYPVTIRTRRDRVVLRQGDDTLNLIIGANMAFRRTVFEQLNGFDTAIGSGAYIGSGNDVDILYRAYRAGKKIVYTPHVSVYHDHGRRMPQEIRRLRYGYAAGRGAIYAKHVIRGDIEMAKMAYWEFRALLCDAARGVRRSDGWKEPLFFLAALTQGMVQRLYYDLFFRWFHKA